MAGWTPCDRQEILPGLTIYKMQREDGKILSKWQYEYRHKRARVRKSTKTEKIVDAIEVAKEAFYRDKVRELKGLDASQTFERSAKEYLDFIDAEYQKNNITKTKWERCNQVVNNYMLEFFDDKLTGEITSEDCADYVEWRQNVKTGLSDKKKLEKILRKQENFLALTEGLKPHQIAHNREVKRTKFLIGNLPNRKPANSTLNSELTVLRGIFKYALKRRQISDIPVISNLSVNAERGNRPFFTEQEMHELIEKADKWRKSGRRKDAQRKGDTDKVSEYYRTLFYFFLRISFLTGLRTGEALALKFNDVELETDDEGEELTILRVRGEEEGARKTGPRTVICSSEVYYIFEEVWRFLGDDQQIWVFPVYGKYMHLKDIKKSWNSLMDYSGMEKDKYGGIRVPYSTRHTYINLMLQKGDMNMYQLADNCGNSVAVIQKDYGRGLARDRIKAKWLHT